MTSMQFSAILESYGDAIGIGGLCLDEQSCCMLELNGVLVTLMWRDSADSLIVYAPIGLVAEETDKVPFYRELLFATVPGGESKGMSIGLDPELNLLTLSISLPGATLSAPMLHQFLDVFADRAAQWQSAVDSLQEQYASRLPGEEPEAADGVKV